MQSKLKFIVPLATGAIVSATFAQDVQVVKIGHVGPLSGAQAHYGKDNENGVRMAIEELNTQNIVIGNKRIKFEIQRSEERRVGKECRL